MEIPDTGRQWQRLREQETPETGLQQLVAVQMELMGVYARLSRFFQGREREMLVSLRGQCMEQVRCIRGMYRMITGTALHTAAVPPPEERAEAALRRCYGKALRQMAAYESRLQQPEYGCVFEHMIREEKNHCWTLTRLMGRLDETR